MAVLGSISFGDAEPFSLAWTHSGGGSNAMTELGSPGAAALGTYWDAGRSASGGYLDGGYGIWTWHAYPDSEAGHLSNLAGWTNSGHRLQAGGPGSAAWPDTFYVRMRLYIENGIIPYSGAISGGGSVEQSRQFKFFIWHTTVYDGDQRVIWHLARGSTAGQSDATHVALHIERNINHNLDQATIAIPIGEWVHLQVAWRHGALNTSYLKAWLNNNVEATPTAQDLSLTGTPVQPDGTTTWYQDQAGYDGQFHIGNAANAGTALETAFTYRIMQVELADSFDTAWAPGGAAPGGSTTGAGHPVMVLAVL